MPHSLRRPAWGWLLVLLLRAAIGAAQAPAPTYPGLVRQPHTVLTVYCTPGAEARTAAMAARCAAALAWLKQPAQLNFAPRVTMLVLGPEDWTRFAKTGEPYGMPHTNGPITLVMAASSNPVWESGLPPLASLPPATAQALAATYRSGSGALSLEKMFDLVALHELGHLCYRQAGLSRPRYWLEEFFASLVLHSYLATHEPAQLPALETFPQVVVDTTDPTQLPYRTLADFEQQYGDMERVQPQNYGWYQCRLHRAVARVYNADPQTLTQLWQALRDNRQSFADPELAAFLGARVSPELRQVMTGW
jgi:hypothetical protein